MIGNEVTLVVVGVHHPGENELFLIGEAVDTLAFLARFAQGRQEHGGQNGDDGDDDEQFDEGERRITGPVARLTITERHGIHEWM